MADQGMALKRDLIEGKVFKGGATWRLLEKFFEKKREEIIRELSEVVLPGDLSAIEEQIKANEYYDGNVRIVDPQYLQNKDYVFCLLDLNAKLCSIEGAEETEGARELIGMNYLKIYSPFKNKLATTRYENDPSLNEKEKKMFTAYDFFKSRGKNVLLLTPDEELIKRATEAGIETSTLNA